jgi:hypothetical protein
MRRPATLIVLLLALLVAVVAGAGCGGGSKGRRNPGDTTPPTLTAAVFVGAGATPVEGDVLRLLFDEPVALVGGALLTDADFARNAGGSLGSVNTAPTAIDSRTVAVTLGAGVNLMPATTTLALAAGNDAVIDAAGNLGSAGADVVVTKGDGDVPVISLFTASNVDAATNGQGPAGGTLQVPTTGFTLDLTYADPTSGVDPTRNEISANVAVTVNGAVVAAGTNLAPSLSASGANASGVSYAVPPAVTFPAGDITFTALVRDSTGMASSPTAFALRTITLRADLRPFETGNNPSQVWYLDTTRDLESYTLTAGAGSTYRVNVVAGPNGREDLYDAFALIGLLGSDTAVNTSVIGRVQLAILFELLAFLGGANVTFTFTAPGTFPAPPSVPYDSFGFSQIALAGAPTQSGVLGLALYDPHNDSQNNDSLADFQSNRLGVFVVTVLDNTNGLGGPSSSLFRQTYDALRAEVGGVPIGGNGQDAARLAGTLNDGRTTTINNAISRMARFIAVVVAHETGHSMGLVKNGPMPVGLYGGDATNFPGSNSEHIKMPVALFPAGSVNVMSPALNFELTQSTSTGFNRINLAYLRERVLYNR